MPKRIDDIKSSRLYSDEPIQASKKAQTRILKFFSDSFEQSKDWFRRNYEEDFIRYSANFQNIPGDVVKPWAGANDYFLPSTMINIENYVARLMENIRGAREFVSVMPRGRDDEEKARMVEQYLRFSFENRMKGFPELVKGIRNTLTYGTSIYTMPWEMKIHSVPIPGKYLFDTETNDWVREIDEESNFKVSPSPPKDFTGIDLTPILNVYENFEIRKLRSNETIEDGPKLELQDPFNVKIDPNGGMDIQDHAYVIIESIETKDQMRRKVEQGIYDDVAVKRLFQFIGDLTEESLKQDNDSHEIRDSVEDIITDFGKKDGIKIWTCYGKQALEEDGLEDEVIAVVAGNGRFLLRLVVTPFQVNGIPYKPILTDRFIELPHRFYGIGISQILENLNYLLNHTLNQILNHGDLYNSPPMVVPEDVMFQTDEIVWGPGQIFKSDTADSFRILETPDIKQSQVLLLQFLEGFIQKSLGINDFVTQGGGTVNNQTAHGLASIMRETNRRIDFYSRNMQENFLKDMFQMHLKESQNFLDKMEIPRIMDLDEEGSKRFEFDNIFNSDLQGGYDIRIFSDSTTASQEFQQLKWQTLIQQHAQMMDPTTGAPIYDIKKMGDENLRAFDEPFPERFHRQQQPIDQVIPPTIQTTEIDGRKPPTPNLDQASEGRLGII